MKSTKLNTILALVSCAGLLAPCASAAFVYHDSAATNGGTFNAGFTLDNLIDGGHTAPTGTEDASSGVTGQGYATSNPPAGGRPLVLTLDFNSTVNLSGLYIWNHTFNGAAGAPANGVNDFTLTFFDGAGGTGSQVGAVFGDNAAIAPATGLYAAEQFAFATRSNVLSVVMTANDHNLTGFIGIRELAFETIPEPSSIALLGLGGFSLLLRRRR